MSNENRILLIAGHGAKPGAINQHLGLEERDLARELRNRVAALLNKQGVTTITEASYLGLNETAAWLQNQGAAPILCSLHFNSFDGTASGSEAIHAENAWDSSKQLAADLSREVAQVLSITDRGAKPESASAHGWLRILHAREDASSVLLEVCFMDNNEEAEKYLRCKESVAEAIANTLKVAVTGAVEASKPSKSKSSGKYTPQDDTSKKS